MPESLEQAISWLSANRPDTRIQGIVFIARRLLSGRAMNIGPKLQELATSDPSELVRCHAIEALAIGDEPMEKYLPTLVGFVQIDRVEELRLRALETLGRLGPAARVVAPELVKILAQPIEDFNGLTPVQQGAFEAFWMLDPAPELAVQVLMIASEWYVSEWNDELSRTYYEQAMTMLKRIGRKIVPELLRPLSDDSYISYHATELLERVHYFPQESADIVLAG